MKVFACRLARVAAAALLIGAATQARAQDVTYRAKQPVVITSFGQSQDANFVDLLGKRLKMDRLFKNLVYAQEIEWAKYKTLIFVIGGSGKGLGNAGLKIEDELKRCQALLDEAKKRGYATIAMHIGGADRRLANSTPFLDFCKKADFMIVKDEGNKDGYFTKASKESGVPLKIVKTTAEVQDVLKTVFGL